MNRYFSSEIRNTKKTLYVGNGDAFTSKEIEMSKIDLMRDIKLGTLFYDHVILSAAFFWKNDILADMIFLLEDFILHGLVLPSVRKPTLTSDIYEYICVRQEETNVISSDTKILKKNGIVDEIVTNKDLDIAKRINGFKSILHQDGFSVRDNFIMLYRQDMKDQLNPSSLYSILHTSAFANKYDNMVEDLIKIAFNRNFSRSVAVTEIHKMNINLYILKKMTYRLSYLFLLSNSKVYNSDLLISSSQKELYKSVKNSVGQGNMYLAYSVLLNSGITFNDIDRLNVRDIIVIKSSNEFNRFNDSYLKIINELQYYEEKSINDVIAYITKKDKMCRCIDLLHIPITFFKNLGKELITVLFYKYTGIEATIYSNSAISTGYDFIDKLIPKIEMFNNTGVDEFSNYIIKRKYEQGVHALIEQIERGI